MVRWKCENNSDSRHLKKKTFRRNWRWVFRTGTWTFISRDIHDLVLCAHRSSSYWFVGVKEKLKSLHTSELKTSSKNLEKRFQNGHILNIHVDNLYNELKLLQKDLLVENNTTNEILNFLKTLNTYQASCLIYKICNTPFI